MKHLFTKATVISALLHLSILGTVGDFSILHMKQQAPTPPTSIALHFVHTDLNKAPPIKTDKKPIRQRKVAPQQLSSPHNIPHKCAQKPAVSPPTDINNISCIGAFMPQPLYPKQARRRKLTGLVTVQFHLTAQGLVASAIVTHSSTYNLLDQAALKAIRTWSFPKNIAETHPDLIAPIRFIL